MKNWPNEPAWKVVRFTAALWRNETRTKPSTTPSKTGVGLPLLGESYSAPLSRSEAGIDRLGPFFTIKGRLTIRQNI